MRCRGFVLLLTAVFLILTGGENSFSAEKIGKSVPVRIGVVSRSTLDMPYYVARDRGLFREEGLEAEIILVRSSLSVQALLGGSMHFGTPAGTAVSAAVSGADVRVIFAMTDRPSFDLIAHPSIATIQQLRGRKIGYGGIGGLERRGERRRRARHLRHDRPAVVRSHRASVDRYDPAAPRTQDRLRRDRRFIGDDRAADSHVQSRAARPGHLPRAQRERLDLPFAQGRRHRRGDAADPADLSRARRRL